MSCCVYLRDFCVYAHFFCVYICLFCESIKILWVVIYPVGWRLVWGWLRLVGSLKLQVSFAKEPYKRDYILLKRPLFLKSPLIVAAPYSNNVKTSPRTTNSWRRVANSTQGQQGPSINLRILIGRTGDCDVDQFFWYVPDD